MIADKLREFGDLWVWKWEFEFRITENSYTLVAKNRDSGVEHRAEYENKAMTRQIYIKEALELLFKELEAKL